MFQEMFKLEAATRELPQHPVVFGITAFAILGLLLYFTLRLGR
jgi:hypothetical protein